MRRQIICIKWGTKYGPDYVNRLYAMVARNLAPPFTFTAFTDDTSGLRHEIQTRPLPPLPSEMPVGVPGKWRKSSLWGPELGGLKGPVLFLDLDLVIVGRLEPFFEHGAPGDVVMARNVVKPFSGLGQTSLYRFPVGKLVPLQEMLAADLQGVGERYRYEQHFVSRNAPGGVRFWPNRWVAHYRSQCVPPFPLNLMRAPKPPRGSRVVIFAGHLNPPEAIRGVWRKTGEPMSARDHVASVLRERRGARELARFALPAPWVAEVWRE